MCISLESLRRIDKTFLWLIVRYLVTCDVVALKNCLQVFLSRFSKVPSFKPEIFLGKINDEEHISFVRHKHPTVSIIIPTYNQWSYTISCLHSIYYLTGDFPYEVIVADDGSDDKTANISKHVSNVRIIKNKQNLQFLKNCNNAARFASGKYLLFLNNDTNVQRNWLAALVDLADNDPSIGIVGSKLVYPDGRLQEAGGIIWRDGSGWNYGWFDDPDKPQYNYARTTDYVSGACLLIRREIWENVGGFDERFAPAYYEDTDLAFKVRTLGYKVAYQPESVVVHFEGVSSGTNTKAGIKRFQEINRMKFVEKWRSVLEREHHHRGQRLPSARTNALN